ncbi:hypothetical protein [Vibrio sp. D431a]|uniref:hypothetical protein n=1 Tax=Vibrio sp. D431a TaxID=2837388 RepID=UPI00255703DD|nr:hypothetical protein [Vibrio sp. D431a]MDK9793737.1 hypothetical protein [Vibrio sp. D431a]
MKTEHLGNIKSFTDYACGTVGCSYPLPIVANSIIELAAFEASDNGAEFVSLHLGNKYHSGAAPENMKYIPASIGELLEDGFSTTTGQMNRSQVTTGEVRFSATKSCSYTKIFEESAPTVTELILKLVARDVKGTLSINFHNYPNGLRCHSESVRKFDICL